MNNPIEHVYASGAKAMNTTIDTDTVVDKTSTYVQEIYRPAVQFGADAHGFLVGDAEQPTSLLIRDLTNYRDGVHRLLAVATNTIDVAVSQAFTASDTPAGTETIGPGYLCRESVNFVGFKLHLTVAGANVEDFEIHIVSVAGSNFTTKTYDYGTNGVDNISNMFDPGISLNAGDVVYCTWANAGSKTWALELTFELKGA